MNCHFNNLELERSPHVNPQMREYTLKVRATFVNN